MCEALVLAGGLGTRLRSVVRDTQKVLTRVAGRPFIDFLLDQLEDAGIRRAVLCTGHGAQVVESEIAAGARTIDIVYSRETVALGTGGALRLGLEQTRADVLLGMNGDSFCAIDLRAFLDFHRAKHARASLVLTQVADTARFGRVECGDDDAVTSFREKDESAGPGWINAGIYCFARGELAMLPLHRPLSLERDVFPKIAGGGLYGFRSAAVFLDIGTPESYAQAANVLRGYSAR